MEGLKEEEEVRGGWRKKSRVGEVMEKKRGQRWRRWGREGWRRERGDTERKMCHQVV